MVDSPILGIPQVGPNQNNKETTINDGISIIERSLNDVHVLTTGVNATISSTDFRRHQVLQIVPTAGSLIISVPAQKRFFAAYNASGTHAFTLRRVGDVSGGITVAAGSYVVCYQDGTNPIKLVADSAAAAFASTFITLSDAPATYTGQALKLARVNAAENALEFWTLDQSVLQLNDTPNSYTPLQYLRVNAAGTGFEYVSANPGGETEFILLTDVPLAYTGAGGYFVKVKSTADGLEFVNGTGLFDFTDLGDVPASYTGESGRLVMVNATEDGLEFVDYPSFGSLVTLALSTANDGFEAGILNPWETEVEADITYYDVSATVGAFGPGAGSYSMVVDGTVASTAISLVLDLTLYTDAANLDNSARITVPYMFIDTLSTGATGTVEVECLSSVGAVLSTLASGTISSPGAWLSGSVVGNIPSGTRSVRIVVTTENGGDPILAGWDGFACLLRITEALSFIDLPDTPAAYTGNAGKVAKVNSAADAIEFSFVTATQITNMPSTLTGQAGKVLQVNPAGTAYVLTELFPAYDIDEAYMVLRVNVTGTGLEWVAGGGGGVTDGDKGDITISGGGTTWTIDAGAVTLGKMADMATASLLGRATAGTGSPEVLSPSQVRTILNVANGATANASDASLRDRATHTGTQDVSTITGLNEAIQDMLGTFLLEGSGIDLTYDDTANTLTIAATGSSALTINTRTANYTLALVDAGAYVRMNLAGANTLTVPKNSVVAFPIGTVIHLRQVGAGKTTVSPVDGTVTINTPETTNLRKQGSSASLIKVATDTWDLTGDLELV